MKLSCHSQDGETVQIMTLVLEEEIKIIQQIKWFNSLTSSIKY